MAGRKWILLGAALLAVFAVFAGSGAAAEKSAGDARTVRGHLSRDDCRRLVEHVAAADVEYKPGVDVHGRKVAPADLPGGTQITLPEDVVIDLDVDLLTMLGIALAPGVDPDIELGKIRVHGNRAYLNGQPLFDEAQARLAEECRRAYSKR